MERLCVLILVGLLLLFGGAKTTMAQPKQDTIYVSVDKESGYNRKKRLFAVYSINHLKNGALLVMLHTRNRTIQLYRDNNAKEIADRIFTEQTIENRMIMDAFKKQFTFCPVYFFHDEHMDDVKKGKYTGIFLDDSLREDRSIVLKEKYYMIADFAPLEEESFEFVQEGGHASSQQTNSGIRSLLVRDNYFVQMRSPFPYSTQARFLKKADRQVASLNEKLLKYYTKHTDANAPYPFIDAKK